MAISLAYLGPIGTNSETAALAYARFLADTMNEEIILHPYPSIAQTIQAAATKEANLAIAPVENSTEGSVTITLDTLWQLEQLNIQQELVLPISHVFLSRGTSLQGLKTVYSHPQALAQCQRWLTHFLPKVKLIPTNSTTEALSEINQDPTSGAIASPRAAKLYDLPVLATNINDYPDNCTRFWVVGLTPSTVGNKISLGFSVPANVPGALVKPLQVFASKEINLSRIESRPTRRSLGEYLFFIDLEIQYDHTLTQEALSELATHTEIIKIFGQYCVTPISPSILSEL
ncbi:prephenate dehydratase [Aphanothece hegewaldii CCALA 016]|uniref:Prephenate dehydratase n=1 Tax=Aphanothece hegewaldii CCALA 016 TaxID=2107694 RepID=A0A2T1LXQ1_9CHRO|nr:prephenate dehydratase [Aphanothece hegewaldii]PSF37167.1 prephenate dehydratase [Aphanothece hegewaldii CCALA 016]